MANNPFMTGQGMSDQNLSDYQSYGTDGLTPSAGPSKWAAALQNLFGGQELSAGSPIAKGFDTVTGGLRQQSLDNANTDYLNNQQKMSWINSLPQQLASRKKAQGDMNYSSALAGL